MKKITIAYGNLWGRTERFAGDYISECFPFLRDHYSFSLSSNPQFAFYSAYGYLENRYDGAIRMIYVGEPGDHFAYGAKISPEVREEGFYHYGITCSANEPNPNHAYMPQGFLHLWLYNNGPKTLIRDPNVPPPRKAYFCNFIYSNGNSRYRVEFFHKLQAYKRVEACGVVERNNRALASTRAYCKDGYLAKQKFQSECKFSISMENNVFPGYNTEKLTDAFVGRSVPIYWGDPVVTRFFNPKAFIRVQDFESDEAAIDYIIKVDKDDALYQSYLNEPPFIGNVIPPELSEQRYLDFFVTRVFAQI